MFYYSIRLLAVIILVAAAAADDKTTISSSSTDKPIGSPKGLRPIQAQSDQPGETTTDNTKTTITLDPMDNGNNTVTNQTTHGNGTANSTTPMSTTASSTPEPSTTMPEEPSVETQPPATSTAKPGGLSTVALIGIIGGVVLALVAAGVVVYFVFFRKRAAGEGEADEDVEQLGTEGEAVEDTGPVEAEATGTPEGSEVAIAPQPATDTAVSLGPADAAVAPDAAATGSGVAAAAANAM